MTTAQVVTSMTFYPGQLSNHTNQCGGPISLTADNQTKQQLRLFINQTLFPCEYRLNVT